jgi:hypothetical protein
MISPNDKSLQKPYCLTRIDFLQQFYTLAKERKIKRSIKNLSDFNNILGLKAAKIFKIEMYNAMQALQANNEAIAIGLEQIPPIIIANIPVDPNLPAELPEQQQDIPANAVAIKRWEIIDEMRTDFDNAKMTLKEKMKALLPEDIFESLKLKAGIEGWSNVEPADVFDYILSDEFSDLSDANLDVIIKKINQPWKKNITLKSNLESMVKENDNLKAAFPHLALSDQDLFRSAFKISKSDNYRLLPIVNNFMSLPGQHITRSLFSDFADYILKNYLIYSHAKNTNHLAFICENVDTPLALATTSTIVDDGGLALAANALPTPSAAIANPPVWNQKDYNEYLTLKAAKNNKGPKQQQRRPNQPFVAPPPPPGAPANTQFGRICFNCGWNKSHNSKSCPVMTLEPTKFTEKQRKLTSFDPKVDDHIIDNVAVNQSCAPGVYGNT